MSRLSGLWSSVGLPWVAQVPGRVLEVGCGRDPISVSADTVVAIDSNILRLAAARPRVSVCGNAGALPFRAAEFDAVLMLRFLCSVRDPLKVLQEVRRVLRDDGIIITGDHVASKFPVLAAAQRWYSREFRQPRGLCSMGLDPVKLLEQSGFSVMDATPLTTLRSARVIRAVKR
ncbi:class I SAM-dependent methyltransferase [Kribbella sp. CA-294648]|uniref:class I SAM-dependent methyltransferase n=1 Tax=Kribbella sp. CA-294648 TaxID=3239948 RepID=UPI003D945B73